MCIAVPGEIICVYPYEALVDIMGSKTTVNIQLIECPSIGEHVLIHAGCAIEKIDKLYYDELFKIMKDLVDGDEQ